MIFLKEDRRISFNGKNMSLIEYYVKKWARHSDVLACDYLYTLRKYEYVLNCKKGFLGRILRFYYHLIWLRKSYKYNIYITPNTVGYGLKLMHFSQGGITINCKSMGCYCSCNTSVLIGNKDGQNNTAMIGDNVVFGPGVKVIGKLTIGNNVFVAANAVVVKDIPANSIVGGIPAKVIKEKTDNR